MGTHLITLVHVLHLMLVLERSNSMVLLTVSLRPSRAVVLEVFTTVLEFLSLVSFHTVESISVSSIPFLVTIHTKKVKMVSSVPDQNSFVHKLLLSLLDMHHIRSIQSVVVFKCNLKNQKLNGFTRALLIASERLLRMKVFLLSLRVLVQMLFVLLVQLWFLFFTQKSLLLSNNRLNWPRCFLM